MTISLEHLADGSPADRNFQTLARLVPDTGGISLFWRCVSGGVTNAGAKNYGTGFTVARTGAGLYTVTYTTAFPSQPAIQFGSDNGTFLRIFFSSASASSVHIVVQDAAGVAADAFINFTATYVA